MARHRDDPDLLFKALADPSRRKLLDLLHAHDGRTLNELCEHLDMTRQGVTQHLLLLESANLVATMWRGREPRGHAVARSREAAFPQSGAAAGDLRALDCQVREDAPEGIRESETTIGENPWLDRPLCT